MDKDIKWQSIKSIEQYMVQWDDDSIVYNPLSGETHQLNLMAVDALLFLQRAATLQSLTQHICTLYQTDSADEIHQHMTQLIEQFDHLGLVAPCLG